MPYDTQWNNAEDQSGQNTREFRIIRENKRDITGALWLPESPSENRTLVCFGHGASGDRYQAPICHLANRFVKEQGLPVLAIDGPVHGLRRIGDGGRTAFFPEYQRQNSVVDMTDDWTCAIEEAQSLDNIGQTKLAYFGLSMGSIFGIPFIASRAEKKDITVATLGLVGVGPSFPHGDTLLAAAAKITCPTLFLMQLEDELFDRKGYLKVFDALASNDKRIHANPGLHPEIPAEEVDFSFNFLTSHINGKVQRKIVNPLAE